MRRWANGDQGQLGLVHDAELLLDVVEVRADGGCGKVQIRGDALHRRAAGKADKDLEFPLRQPLDRRLRAAVEFRERELLGERRVEVAAGPRQPPTPLRAAPRGRLRFDKNPRAPSCIARRAWIGSSCADRVKTCAWAARGADSAQRLEPSHARHGEIHHHHHQD